MSIRLTRFLASLMPLLAWGSLGFASTNGGLDNDPPGIAVSEIPEFSDIRFQLQALVNARAFHDVNHFCAVGWPGDKNNPAVADIYWPTQDKIIVWWQGETYGLISPISYIDIEHDVVKTIDPKHPPGILPWTRAGVARLLRNCQQNGNKFTIQRMADDWVKISKFVHFSNIKDKLTYLVDNEADKDVNDFCVVGQRSHGFLDGFVYWKTAGKLIFWLPDKEGERDPVALAVSPINIDLAKNLRDADDAGSGDFYMRRSYAAADIRACLQYGEFLTIKKSKWEWPK